MGPRFRSRPTTKNGVSRMLQASFSAMESMALFCTHVTSAVAPVGRRLWMMWKIVVDFPAAGLEASPESPGEALMAACTPECPLGLLGMVDLFRVVPARPRDRVPGDE